MIPFNILAGGKHGHMLFHRMDAYVGRSLDYYGGYGEDEEEFLLGLVGPGSIVLDGGANIGAFTVPFAKRVGIGGRVVAVEPQRLTFQALNANVALNSLPNVDTVRAALGRAPGSVKVPVLDLLQPHNVGGLSLGSFKQGESVPVVRVDDMGLDAITLIKLDIEGAERDALAGARRTIKQHQPLLYVEADRQDKVDGLVADLRALGYRLYWHTPRLYRRRNFRGTTENVFADISSFNILALPAHDDREFGLEKVA